MRLSLSLSSYVLSINQSKRLLNLCFQATLYERSLISASFPFNLSLLTRSLSIVHRHPIPPDLIHPSPYLFPPIPLYAHLLLPLIAILLATHQYAKLWPCAERQKLTRRVESLTKKLKDSALKVKQRYCCSQAAQQTRSVLRAFHNATVPNAHFLSFPLQTSRAPLEVELAEAQRKLNYVMYFPRGIKYISVLKGGDEMASEAIAKRGA